MAVKASATITLSRVNDGAPGRTYFIEASSNVLKRSKDNTISPNFIEFKAYYRDGNSATRTPYAGRFIIEETADGNTWRTIYTSNADENAVRHQLYSLLSTQNGQIIATENGSVIGIPRDVTSVRCKLYASGGTSNLMDMQSVPVVVDVDNLTHEEIFALLTNQGEIKGIYKEGNQLYISFSYARGGTLALGGKNNGNGKLEIFDNAGKPTGTIDNQGAKIVGSIETKSSNEILSMKLDKYGLASFYEGETITEFYSGGRDNLNRHNTSIELYDKADFHISGNEWAMLQINPMNDHEVRILGNFKVISGTKSRVARTQNFQNRLLYCYETPTPMFSDIGCAGINKNGIAIIDIDPVFCETVNTNIEYQVFLQKEGQGDLWVDEKTPDYFVVKGTPNLRFSWEIKCIQKGFESLRLEDDGFLKSLHSDLNASERDLDKEMKNILNEYDEEMEGLINESSQNY